MSVLLSFFLTLQTSARSRAALQLEVLALRHQLRVLQRTRPRRLRLAKADRWLWSLLSRMLHGTYVAVEPYHLSAYVDEQAFRFNQRKDTDAGRFLKALAMAPTARLSYKDLTRAEQA